MPHPYHLTDEAGIMTPALVFFPAFIRQNIARIVELAGGTGRLRPHVKTHKTREITRMQLEAGVTKHKCATIAEAEMLADAGAPDVLVAYPLVGPNPMRLAALAKKFPNTKFSSLIVDETTANLLSAAAAAAGRTLGFYLDLNVGMNRTGVVIDDSALSLYEYAAKQPGLTEEGLHSYDGQNHQESRTERHEACMKALFPVLEMRSTLQRRGYRVERIIAGGTPNFPVYAAMQDIPGLECSPGTYVLHDHGYGTRYPDLDGITPAAVLLTRVISRPTPNRVTFDLGNKSVAPDPVLTKRAHILDLPEYTIVVHSEEHLVIETPHAANFHIGDLAYVLPGHVCPTCALHREALIAENGHIVGAWRIASRDRFLTV